MIKIFLKGQLIRISTLIFVSVLLVSGFWGCRKNPDPVELTMASWRAEDVVQMNRLNALFTEAHPNITIRYQAVETSIYNDKLGADLLAGTAADIMLLRSFDMGRGLYDAGYLRDLNADIPALSSFSPGPLKGWSTESGVTYGVPTFGVTQGVYYQKAVFDKYNILEPATWDEFIAACEKLLAAGETVIAQGAYDNWTLYEDVFCGLGANFYGGEAARQGLMAGDMKLTDPNFIRAFEAVESLRKYFPRGFETLDYPAMRELFASGKAAIFIGGSWEISLFESLGSGSAKIGWFAPPVVKAGDQIQYCFQIDGGYGINRKTRHPAEAVEYLKWLTGNGFAASMMAELPGFFTYVPGTYTLNNPLAQEMFDTSTIAGLTLRLMVEKLSAQSPRGNALMNTALCGMMAGSLTPQSAAAYVQEQLDTWYRPGGK
jgi:raffinose/stachyose/melibiose transport system substrate-binding protein